MISEVAGQYNAQDIENQVRLLWEREQTYRKVRQLRVGGKKFFFVDGPPYTTGRIHLGTAWNKVIKDSVLRYRSMNGCEVKDRAGWDMHGLPIEVKVEESFGFKTRRISRLTDRQVHRQLQGVRPAPEGRHDGPVQDPGRLAGLGRSLHDHQESSTWRRPGGRSRGRTRMASWRGDYASSTGAPAARRPWPTPRWSTGMRPTTPFTSSSR